MSGSRLSKLIGIAVLVSCGELAGQRSALLVPGSKVVVSGRHEMGFIDPARCDDGGNIYLKSPESGPVTKISPDGREVARFSLDSASDPEVKRGSFYAFAVNGRGEVFALVHAEQETFVVRFDEDGKYEETVKLNAAAVFPYRIAVFPTGEFLLIGIVQRNEGASAGSSAYTAIFDSRGELIKNLSLTEDVAKKSASAGANPKGKGEGAADELEFERAIGSGDALISPDGYAYLIRNSPSPVVYVATSQGTVVRRMVLHAPANGLRPVGAPLIALAKLIVPFGKESAGRTLRHPESYSVYDAETGDHLIDYEAAPELAGGMLCSTRNGFVFVGTQDMQMALISATPR
jgi:hypothetical protein